MEKCYFVKFVNKQFHKINAFKWFNIKYSKTLQSLQTKRKIKQIFMKESLEVNNIAFLFNICHTFLISDIHLRKLNNSILKKFVENCTG